MAKILLRWVEDKVFTGTDSNGHSVVIGRTSEDQHHWQGVKPSELLLMAAASCAAFDLVEILSKQRKPLLNLHIETTGDQLEEPPYAFIRIHNHYVVKGAVNPQKLIKAIQLSEDKYCSVISSLRPQVKVTSDFEIVE
jgi:putative redox protein